NWCSTDRLNMRSSGFLRFGEMGRTRPHDGGQATPGRFAGFGALGNAATMAAQLEAGLSTAAVCRFTPSKFRESRTTLLKASIVTSAALAFTIVPGRTSQLMPRRGCQLLPSEEQAGMMPLPWKQLPPGPLTVPPLKAPAS